MLIMSSNMTNYARHKRFLKSREKMVSFFLKLPLNVFMIKDIRNILNENRLMLNLPKKTTASEFIFLLEKEKILQEDFVEMPNEQRIVRYLTSDASVYELALTLKRGSYLSHYTALFLHGLTDNIPRNVYTNLELRKTNHIVRNKLEQESINRAFSNKMRHSQQIAQYKDIKIFLLNTKNVDQIGVNKIQWRDTTLLVTDIERTLIDITVRPDYAGGINEVCNAYVAAKDRVSINRLVAILKKIDYTYPYHQAIGFYLEKAGYSPASVNLLHKFEKNYDFFLTYKMQDPDYSDKWKLFYPRGF